MLCVSRKRLARIRYGSKASSCPATTGVRTIFRFSPDVRTLLISGGLTDGNELAGAPALVDVSEGGGHILLFSFNPFWRGETLGSYGIVFNALLHHGSLSAGRAMAER